MNAGDYDRRKVKQTNPAVSACRYYSDDPEVCAERKAEISHSKQNKSRSVELERSRPFCAALYALAVTCLC